MKDLEYRRVDLLKSSLDTMKYVVFMLWLLFIILGCDSATREIGGGFAVWEHDVSTTRGVYYNDQGIGPKPVCKVGFNETFIWVKLCGSKDGVTHYIVNRNQYVSNPMQRESTGYQEFTSDRLFKLEMQSLNISPTWTYIFTD